MGTKEKQKKERPGTAEIKKKLKDSERTKKNSNASSKQ
jgi:hypothetical protein